MEKQGLQRMALLLSGLLATPAVSGAVPDLCQHGRRQSPIDIVSPVSQVLPPILFRYRDGPLTLTNDGHTVRVRIADGNRMIVGKETHVLQQIHFHTPSGDRIGGKEFDMAAHFLHKSASGQLVVVVALFRKGSENWALAGLLPRIPKQVNGHHKGADFAFNPTDLLPTERQYYSYQGSLTAFPCSEGVKWLLMKQPLELSAEQLTYYKTLFPDNARPVQPLNGRVVKESL